MPTKSELEQQVADLQQKLEQLESESAALPELGAENFVGEKDCSTTTTKPLWRFRVAVNNKTYLEPQEISAVDESEAIRLYALQVSDHGNPLDPTSCRFQVECLNHVERLTASAKQKHQRMVERGYWKPEHDLEPLVGV